MNKKMLGLIILCAVLVFYFTKIGFGFEFKGQIISAIVAYLLLYVAGLGGWQRFYFVALTSIFSAISLGCSFFHFNPDATGPFVSSFVLSSFNIMSLSVFFGILAMGWYSGGKSKDRFVSTLFFAFVLNWIILAFNVSFFEDWVMENALNVPFVILLYIAHKWFRFSNLSYALIFAYMMLNIFGSHYTYSEVPFGFWMQDVFGMVRNHYDRIVHFAFGFLLAYPIREVIHRISNTKGFWSYWFPIEFVLAFSCVYELLEWFIAVVFGGDLGVAYLGSQGDIWDAQKDMFLAGLGSVIAMLIVAMVVWHFKRSQFWKEIRESLTIKKKRVLGEEELERMEKGTQ